MIHNFKSIATVCGTGCLLLSVLSLELHTRNDQLQSQLADANGKLTLAAEGGMQAVAGSNCDPEQNQVAIDAQVTELRRATVVEWFTGYYNANVEQLLNATSGSSKLREQDWDTILTPTNQWCITMQPTRGDVVWATVPITKNQRASLDVHIVHTENGWKVKDIQPRGETTTLPGIESTI